MLASHAPDTLTQRAAADLEGRAREFFDALLTPEHLRFDGRVAFSGRSVVAPGPELRYDQVGVPEEMAWSLFGPLAARELGRLDRDKSSVAHHEDHEDHEGLKEEQQVAYESHAALDRPAEIEARTERAAHALDAVMARTWLIINRKPSFTPTAFLAFHPIRIPGHTIRLHPFACPLLDADFDGDQVAVFLPLTEAGQQEADEKLTIAAHLTRDPSLITQLQPRHEALWGLALLSRTPEGRQEIAQLVGREVAAPDGFITRHTLADALRDALNREGVAQTLDLCERLLQRGFEVAQASGASVGPFIDVGADLRVRPADAGGNVGADQSVRPLAAWESYIEELAAGIATRPYTPDGLGNLLLAAKSGARGALQQVQSLVGPWRLARTAHDQVIPITHGYTDGLTLEELFALISEARESLAQIARRWEQAGAYAVESSGATTFNVLARARRAKRPGIVFALAAASSEVDPLLDAESRLFVGIG
jgi:DNA-directed RNA polymerase beta' subunit